MTSACLDRLAPLSTRCAFDRQRNTESTDHVDHPERVDRGDELSFTARKDLTTRSAGTEKGQEKTAPKTLLLSPDTASCNVWGDVGARKYRAPRIGEIPRDVAIDRSPTASPTSRAKRLISDTGQSPTDAPGPSITEYSQEVRKDSALYLEEEAETLTSRKPTTDADVPRRQSSGYVSTRGSFDDNRRNSATSGDTQQDPSPYLKERRRSSKLSSKVLAGRVEESIDETAPNTSEEIMPTTGVHRKMSSSGLDMPNIEEMKGTDEIQHPQISRKEDQPPAANISKLQLLKTSAKFMPVKDSCSVDVEVVQPRKNVRLLQKKGKILPVDTLMSTDVDGNAIDQVVSIKSELEVQQEEDDDVQTVTEGKDRNDGAVSELNSALSDLSVKGLHEGDGSKKQTEGSADNSQTADTRRRAGETMPSQQLPGDASNVTDRPPTIVCPPSSSLHHSSPQGSPKIRRAFSKESENLFGNQDDNQHLNEYEVQGEIGKGSFGVVKKVYNKYNHTLYAMKILNKKKLMKKAGIFGRVVPGKTSVDPLANVHREIAILKKLDHPNVVKLIEVLDHPDKNNFYLVFELVHRGEILVIPTNQPLKEETARRYFRDVVMGVEYLHYQKIVHRDIKPSNLLVDRNDRIKIADLGVSTELREPGELLSGQIGTPAFSAPETTVTGAEFSGPPCDLWSMGVTLFALLVGDVPWRSSDSKTVQALIRDAPLAFPEGSEVSANLRSLIGRMLEKPPEKRATIIDVKQHPWLTRDGAEPLPSQTDTCRVPITVTNEEVTKLGTLVLVKNMLRQHSLQNPFLPKRSTRSTANNEAAVTTLTGSVGQGGVSSSHDVIRDEKSECFQKTGRSNSAPDSCDWHTSGRQVSVETPLPSVMEVSSQESEVDRR
ncbi:hypothetical protein DMN91_002390 [Ooceraea biroi]|uniref:Protein kinase domain-containing protein n=1 Tax=Ooceraea biroi TaxID=2015173 RepID=A0A3L8DVH3_OOCBI|nr:protein kinase 3 isoform X1 [Ooceraea biroi]RLU24302.1 hypothetical protein DMN91_002390 [Ooceraea biroi]